MEKVGKIRKAKQSRKAHKSQDEFILEISKWNKFIKEGYFIARVVEVHKRYCFVSSEPEINKIDTSDVWLATVARKFLKTQKSERNFVAVGDRVLCKPETNEDNVQDLPQCVVQHLAPRFSKISRVDPISPTVEHILASNIDQLVIVTSFLNPRIRFGLIDRYLILAENSDIEPIIVFNKKDLLEADETKEKFVDECNERVNIYKNLGYSVFEVSALKRAKSEPWYLEFQEKLTDKVSIFTGHSGVGKSTLVNLFKPEIIQEVEKNSDIFYKGRHTTTYASFIKLGTGGFVIDTPGIRSFAILDSFSKNIGFGFKEFVPLLVNCKYRECQHLTEPGCQVLDALASGAISKFRYDSYKRIVLGESGREGRGDGEFD